MPPRVRRQPKTWSQFGVVRKKPSPYEVVTGKFHYHFRREEQAPFEIDKDAPLNRWYLQYREGSALQLDDWEQFRDPYKLTYRDYIARQADREKYLDGLIDRAERLDAVSKLDERWVATLKRLLVPTRFPLHVLQMIGLYVGQMAPSSYITNCQHFSAADEVRRIQRIAYWTKVLANAHGDELAATETARNAWEKDAEWQPLRKLLEESMIVYDWGEAFAVLDLAIKPAVDTLLNRQFSSLAQENGDTFLAELLAEFQVDSQRQREWSKDLVAYVVERVPEHRELLAGWVRERRPQVDDAVAALADMFGGAPQPLDAATVVRGVQAQHSEFLELCGL